MKILSVQAKTLIFFLIGLITFFLAWAFFWFGIIIFNIDTNQTLIDSQHKGLNFGLIVALALITSHLIVSLAFREKGKPKLIFITIFIGAILMGRLSTTLGDSYYQQVLLVGGQQIAARVNYLKNTTKIASVFDQPILDEKGKTLGIKINFAIDHPLDMEKDEFNQVADLDLDEPLRNTKLGTLVGIDLRPIITKSSDQNGRFTQSLEILPQGISFINRGLYKNAPDAVPFCLIQPQFDPVIKENIYGSLLSGAPDTETKLKLHFFTTFEDIYVYTNNTYYPKHFFQTALEDSVCN